MTPEEQEAEDIRQAQEAKDIADAQAAKQAEIDAAAGVTNEGTGQGLAQATGLKELARASGEGVTGLADLPEEIATGIKNISPRLTNSAADAASAYAPGVDFGPPPVPVQLSSPYQSDLGKGTSARDVYNYELPPDPEHPWARAVGNFAGPAIVEGAVTGGLSIPGQIRGIRRAIATTTGGFTGGEAGGAIDRSVGGDGSIGSTVGSAIGGGIAPGIVTQAGWKGLSSMFTNADSPGLVRAADNLRVPLSLGLVGKKFAGQVEDATASLPFAGGPAFTTRENQYTALDKAGQDIATAMRGGPSDVRGINPSTIGDKVKDLSTTADASASAAQDAVLNPLYEQVGRDEPIDQTAQLEAMDRIRRGSQPQYRAPVDTEIANVNASRLDPLNAPKVVDPGLEAQLQMKMNQAQRKLQGARTSGDAKAAQDELDSLQAQQTANRGQTFQETIESRSKTGRRIEGQQPLDAAQTLAIKASQTDAMKQAARLAGVSPEEFDAANARYGELAVQREIFDKISNAPGQGEAYNKLFGGTSRQNLDQLNALYEHAPDQLRSAMADEFELRMRGSGAGLSPRGANLNTVKTGPNWWSGIPEEARTYVSPNASTDAAANDLSGLMRADARRPTRTTPGSGGNTLGIGGMFASGLGLGTPSAAAYGVGRAFTSPEITRRIVNPGGWLNDRNTLARILAAASGAQGTQ